MLTSTDRRSPTATGSWDDRHFGMGTLPTSPRTNARSLFSSQLCTTPRNVPSGVVISTASTTPARAAWSRTSPYVVAKKVVGPSVATAKPTPTFGRGGGVGLGDGAGSADSDGCSCCS